MSVENRRPPLTTILLWIAGAVTLVLTGYDIFSSVVLTLPFPYNYLIMINSFMVGVVEIRYSQGWYAAQNGWRAGCNPPSVLDDIQLNGLPTPQADPSQASICPFTSQDSRFTASHPTSSTT